MPAQVDESVHMEIFVLEPFFIVELVGVYVTGNRGTVLYNNRNSAIRRKRNARERFFGLVAELLKGVPEGYIYLEGLLEGFRHAARTGPIPAS